MIHIPLRLKKGEMVSGKLNSFLRGFEVDKLMPLCLANTIRDIVANVMDRVIL